MNKPATKKTKTVQFHLHKGPKVVKSRDKAERWLPGTRGEENGELCLMCTSFSSAS